MYVCAHAYVCECMCDDFVILVHQLWALLFIYIIHVDVCIVCMCINYNFVSIMILDSGIHFGVWSFLVNLAVYSFLFIFVVVIVVFCF
jgi:hypothetical protein